MRLSSPKFHTSALSKYCDEQLPGDFHFLDGDEVVLRYPSQPIVYARETRTLRILESKACGEEIRRSQREALPLLAAAIRLAVQHNILAEGSGVFIVEGSMPYEEGASVSQVLPPSASRAVGLQVLGPVVLAKPDVDAFIRCRGRLPR